MRQIVSLEDVTKAFDRFSRQALESPLIISHCGKESFVLLSHAEYLRLKRRDRAVLTLGDCTDDDRAAVAASRASAEAAQYDDEVRNS